ncbi:MAG: PBP1A family penicillin-binding protein [Caldisericia bacterium]|nr:PBP1A family penicillin-binding protein [Caldisericia bacterium]
MLIFPSNNYKAILHRKRTSAFKKVIVFFTLFILICVSSGLFFLYTLYSQYSQELPKPEDIVIKREESSRVFDRDGNLLQVLFLTEQRIYVSLNEISNPIQKAIVASEDERFYLHEGVDFKAVLRALYVNFLQGDLAQGGSTLTQQLARNVFLTQEKTYTRKLKEIILSMRIEEVFRKTEILEMYINQCYFGEGCYGIETASRKYFNKNASEINLAEASLLTAVLPSPSTLSIYRTFEDVKVRQMFVLEKMVKNGFINEQEAEEAYNAKITVFEGNSISNNNVLLLNGIDYFIDYIEEQVINQLSSEELYMGGLRIYTTISKPVQEACWNSLNEVLTSAEKSGKLPTDKIDSLEVLQPQGAVVALAPSTGEILAMVGGRDYENTKFNRALALRQPGSSFKVFPYSAALDTGVVAPESREVSEYINIDGWAPKEWSGGYFGPMTIRRAIQISSNIVAVKTLLKVGIEKVLDYAYGMGIETKLLPVPSIALGSVDVRPLDMASAFGTISNNGEHVKPVSILRIEKRGSKKAIYERKIEKTQALSPQAAWLMTQLLQTPISPGGTASSLRVPGIHMAGKTGTTENYKDGWFVGFTKGISMAVYIGSDSKEVDLSYIRNYGSEFAGKIFKSIIQKVYKPTFPLKLQNERWSKPEGIVSIRVCNETGLRANRTCYYHVETRINGLFPSYCLRKHPPPPKAEEDKKENGKDKKDEEKDKKIDKKPDDKNEKSNNSEKNREPEKNPDKQPSKPEPSKPPKDEPSPEPSKPPEPASSFQKPAISDTGDFSVSFSSQKVSFGSTTVIEFTVWDPQAASIELYVNGSLVAVLNQYPYRYYYSPINSGENIFQAVLRGSSKNILGNKIIPIFVFSS